MNYRKVFCEQLKLMYLPEESYFGGYLGSKVFYLENGRRRTVNYVLLGSAPNIFSEMEENFDFQKDCIPRLKRYLDNRIAQYLTYPEEDDLNTLKQLVCLFNARSKTFTYPRKWWENYNKPSVV